MPTTNKWHPVIKNPDEIDVVEWQNREEEGILYVPNAGEILYRLREHGIFTIENQFRGAK